MAPLTRAKYADLGVLLDRRPRAFLESASCGGGERHLPAA
jgi:hypothetical protein